MPRFLQLFLARAGVFLSLAQLSLLRQLTLAWLKGCNGKMVCAAQFTPGRHRTSLARFLNKSSWDAPSLRLRRRSMTAWKHFGEFATQAAVTPTGVEHSFRSAVTYSRTLNGAKPSQELLEQKR
jgi:hypothetical protein